MTDFFKSMNNSVYGKAMENFTDLKFHVRIETNAKDYQKLVPKLIWFD